MAVNLNNRSRGRSLRESFIYIIPWLPVNNYKIPLSKLDHDIV